jgi:TPP-dependent 2-oxoacid decarboxylase
MPQTAIQYVLSRLRQLGVTDIFGVPGDYAFPITDGNLQRQEHELHRLVQRDQRGLFG